MNRKHSTPNAGGHHGGRLRPRLLERPSRVHPTPYTLHPTPCTPHPTPYTLHPTPYTLLPAPYTLMPAGREMPSLEITSSCSCAAMSANENFQVNSSLSDNCSRFSTNRSRNVCAREPFCFSQMVSGPVKCRRCLLVQLRLLDINIHHDLVKGIERVTLVSEQLISYSSQEVEWTNCNLFMKMKTCE